MVSHANTIGKLRIETQIKGNGSPQPSGLRNDRVSQTGTSLFGRVSVCGTLSAVCNGCKLAIHSVAPYLCRQQDDPSDRSLDRFPHSHHLNRDHCASNLERHTQHFAQQCYRHGSLTNGLYEHLVCVCTSCLRGRKRCYIPSDLQILFCSFRMGAKHRTGSSPGVFRAFHCGTNNQ